MRDNTPTSELLSIVIVSYNSEKMITTFLNNLFSSFHSYQYPVIIVDNASTDCTVKAIIKTKYKIQLIQNIRNEGYGAGLNLGIKEANTPYIALMNPDIFIEHNGFEPLVSFLENHENVAGVSGLIAQCIEIPEFLNRKHLFCNNTIGLHFRYETMIDRLLFYSGLSMKLPTSWNIHPWENVKIKEKIEVARLNGCFGVYTKKVLEDIGLFDPRFFLYFEEDDIALRIKKFGYALYVIDDVVIAHINGHGSNDSGSSKTDLILLNSQYLYFTKHYNLIYSILCFVSIWIVITICLLYFCIFNKDLRSRYFKLWMWHFRCLLRLGKLPTDTIPHQNESTNNYDCFYLKKYETHP